MFLFEEFESINISILSNLSKIKGLLMEKKTVMVHRRLNVEAEREEWELPIRGEHGEKP